MPVSVFGGGGINIQPTIIPGQVDPIARALRLAELRNLELKPEQENRLFQQRDREISQRATLSREEQGVQTRGQDIQSRGQDLTAASASEEHKVQRENLTQQLAIHHEDNVNRLNEAFLAHAYSNGISPEVLADVLHQRGAPEYATALLNVDRRKAESEAPTLAATLLATKDQPEAFQAQLGAIRNKGAAYVEGVKKLVPKEYHGFFDSTPGTTTQGLTYPQIDTNPLQATVANLRTQREATDTAAATSRVEAERKRAFNSDLYQQASDEGLVPRRLKSSKTGH